LREQLNPTFSPDWVLTGKISPIARFSVIQRLVTLDGFNNVQTLRDFVAVGWSVVN